jgi:Papain-like cysteine protease AvrRpt2
MALRSIGFNNIKNMLIISYQDWMKETKAGPLTPRSPELKAIDEALRHYGAEGKTVRLLINLKKAIANWIRVKGSGWRTSERNKNRAMENLANAVDALLVDLQLDVPLVGQKTGYDSKPLMQPNATGKLVQHGFMACWYAAAQMVSYYYRPGPRLGIPDLWRDDKGMTVPALAQLARVEGLIAVPKPATGLTSDNVRDLLIDYGPIWAAGYYIEGHPKAGHAIVFTGVNSDMIRYNDPWEPKAKQRQDSWVNAQLLKLPNVLMVKDPSRY